jgi:hypothetical protein
MKNLIILLTALLIVSCKKEDVKPDPINYVYQDANVQIDTCIAVIVNGKFQVQIQGKFLNHNVNGCELTVLYNNAVVMTGTNINTYIYPYAASNYTFNAIALTADIQYKNTLRVFILPDLNSSNRNGIELKVTFK